MQRLIAGHSAHLQTGHGHQTLPWRFRGHCQRGREGMQELKDGEESGATLSSGRDMAGALTSSLQLTVTVDDTIKNKTDFIF